MPCRSAFCICSGIFSSHYCKCHSCALFYVMGDSLQSLMESFSQMRLIKQSVPQSRDMGLMQVQKVCKGIYCPLSREGLQLNQLSFSLILYISFEERFSSLMRNTHRARQFQYHLAVLRYSCDKLVWHMPCVVACILAYVPEMFRSFLMLDDSQKIYLEQIMFVCYASLVTCCF